MAKSNRVRKVSVAFTATISDLEKQMKKVQKLMDQTSKNLKKAGEVLTKNITLPVIAVGTALVGMALQSAKAADDLMDLSSITGISTSQLQEMAYAGEILGTDLETITGAQTKLTRSVYEAVGGNKEYIKAFEKLGVKIYDTNGNIKDANTLFWEALEALGKIEDPILRDGLAMEIFGKSARDLNPLIKTGADEFKRLAEEMKEFKLTPEQLKALADMNDSFFRLKFGIGAVTAAIASELVPVLKPLIDSMTEALIPLRDRIIGVVAELKTLSPETQRVIAGAIGVAVAAGPLLIALGAVTNALKTLLPVITNPTFGVIAGILSLITQMALLKKTFELFKTEPEEAAKKLGILALAFGPAGFISTQIGAFIYFLKENWTKIWQLVSDKVSEAASRIAGIVGGIISTIQGAINKVQELLGMQTSGNFSTGTSGGGGGKSGGGAMGASKWYLPGMAEGGILTAPRVVLAGEAGPEAIIPLDRLGDMKGNTTVQVILDGRVIQEYIDDGLGNRLAAFGGAF